MVQKDKDIAVFVMVISLIIVAMVGFIVSEQGKSREYLIDLDLIASDNNLDLSDNDELILGGKYNNSYVNQTLFKINIDDNVNKVDLSLREFETIKYRIDFYSNSNLSHTNEGFTELFFSTQKNDLDMINLLDNTTTSFYYRDLGNFDNKLNYIINNELLTSNINDLDNTSKITFEYEYLKPNNNLISRIYVDDNLVFIRPEIINISELNLTTIQLGLNENIMLDNLVSEYKITKIGVTLN